MYRVVLPASRYHTQKSFIDWDNDYSFVGDYIKYLQVNQLPEMEYINDVSQDLLLEQIPVELYDNLVSGHEYGRFRIFHFKSEAHYTWFTLRFA